MTNFKLIVPEKHTAPIYQHTISFRPEEAYMLFIESQYLIIYSQEFLPNERLADQIELPLASLDSILATIARFKLPHDKGGLGGLNNSDSLVIKGEDIFIKKIIHPHYGLEMYSITNFNRRSYITQALKQEIEIFQETIDAGLLEKLIDINKNYHDGAYA